MYHDPVLFCIQIPPPAVAPLTAEEQDAADAAEEIRVEQALAQMLIQEVRRGKMRENNEVEVEGTTRENPGRGAL